MLLAAWLLYFTLHSVLASLWLKHRVAARWPYLMPAYRLGFNLLALVGLVPPLWLTFSLPGPRLWAWTGAAAWIANGLALAALAGFLWSLRWYDGAEFLGLRQWRASERRVEDQERLHISPLHRFVRHPWYSLGLVLVWTRDMNPGLLLSSLAITGYFLLGSRLEERKLIVYYGDRYRHYRSRVPALIPLPWRHLSRAEARELIAEELNSGRGTW